MKHTGKRKTNNVTLWGMLFLLVVCIGLAIFILPKADDNLSEISSAATTGPSESPDKNDEVYELRGTVKDATMNTLTVQAEDNNSYSFGTVNVKISTGETGILIGNPVIISYQGKLDPQATSQKVTLLSITVMDADAKKSDLKDKAEVSAKAQEILDKMTLEEKVGQMFIVRCPDSDAAQKVSEYHLGGYILFGQDFAGKDKNAVIQDIQSYQSAAQIPLFIGADEEGGTVNRISTNPQLRAVPFWSPQELYAEGGFDLVKSDTEEKCELLQSLGINLNLAPVCDISQDPNDFIYQRSFGKDAKETAAYVRLVVETMSKEGTGSVLKHFPGYGNNQDTHTGIAYDNRPYETFANSDFLPFQAGIEAGANMVLVSHNVVSCMDDQHPASLSPEVHKILREDLGFEGVIITDDLAMDGVRDYAQDSEVAVQAVLAGNDMLCCTDFELQLPAVMQAVQDGSISEARINESVLRILELKISLGVIQTE